MSELFVFDRIQFVSIIFSLFILGFIFNLVKKRRMKEEYSLLWFFMSLFLLYMSVDRYAIDRLGALVGVAYPPSVLMLLTTGFTFLVLVHLSVVVTRLSEQNNELIQEMGLGKLEEAKKNADILVIVPAYNEGNNIVEVITDLLNNAGLPLDVLVINDGSIDHTGPAARATGRALVIDLPKNLGIGGAVQTGFKYAARHNYQIAVQFDGDGQHLASELPKLVQAIQARHADLVIGSRFVHKHAGFRSTFVRRLGIRTFQLLNSLLIGQKITDNTSGFRAYSQPAIRFLAKHYPTDYPEPEAVILLGRNGFKITEEATEMRERQGGDSSISGLLGIYYMLKVTLGIIMTALRKPLTRD
ncbi:DUF2304 family protein [Desulfurivibrio alkaliphilus]|uniref:Glycosyl transferase family 2 n=1 Tax=Desulfurivibrio alkaliphilus (strain DSM 19089 / UNIQEM U267 / AHT2) TaxID=589865 RepID=D6YZR8_DESAT|nr:DUF2304 family protein [Desulfurivibrio alkaliphilus]ADH85075.1 glycosyl transferase family 2 [Desulfurivibrio alkaliphilus AHT 2]